jgi:hypothetical protein
MSQQVMQTQDRCSKGVCARASFVHVSDLRKFRVFKLCIIPFPFHTRVQSVHAVHHPFSLIKRVQTFALTPPYMPTA